MPGERNRYVPGTPESYTHEIKAPSSVLANPHPRARKLVLTAAHPLPSLQEAPLNRRRLARGAASLHRAPARPRANSLVRATQSAQGFLTNLKVYIYKCCSDWEPGETGGR